MNKKVSDKLFFRIALGISLVVLLLVIVLNKRILNPPSEFPVFIYQLPKLHAFLNSCTAILLLFSLRAIMHKKIEIHKKINLTAFSLSALFLISYVTYHFFVPETTFGGEGMAKSIYYVILISHIILAAVVLPLILISFWFGLNMKVARHKKIVRFSYPIWLYVAVTGVVVYIMISPYYLIK